MDGNLKQSTENQNLKIEKNKEQKDVIIGLILTERETIQYFPNIKMNRNLHQLIKLTQKINNQQMLNQTKLKMIN